MWLIFVEASPLPVIPGGGAGKGKHVTRNWGAGGSVGVGSVSSPETLCLAEASRQVERMFYFPSLSLCLVSREMDTMSSTCQRSLENSRGLYSPQAYIAHAYQVTSGLLAASRHDLRGRL